nr:immunoglobulin heavy chain junction region [Macaca mulatta]
CATSTLASEGFDCW